MSLISIVLIVAALGLGLLVGYYYRRNVAEAKIAKAEDAVKQLYSDAQKRAEEIKKEKILEAKEEVYKIRSDAEKENRERRAEIQKNERRIFQREETLDKKLDALEQREKAIALREEGIVKEEEDIHSLHQQQLAELEKISGLSMEDARSILLTNVEQEARHDAAILLSGSSRQPCRQRHNPRTARAVQGKAPAEDAEPHAGGRGRGHAVAQVPRQKAGGAPAKRDTAAVFKGDASFAFQHEAPLVLVLVVPLAFWRGVAKGDDALDAHGASSLEQGLHLFRGAARPDRVGAGKEAFAGSVLHGFLLGVLPGLRFDSKGPRRASPLPESALRGEKGSRGLCPLGAAAGQASRGVVPPRRSSGP